MIALILLVGAPAAAQQNEPPRLSGVDLLVRGQELIGRRVVISECLLTTGFGDALPCRVFNSGGEYIGLVNIDRKTLPLDDVRRTLERCASMMPGPDCRVTADGVLRRHGYSHFIVTRPKITWVGDR